MIKIGKKNRSHVLGVLTALMGVLFFSFMPAHEGVANDDKKVKVQAQVDRSDLFEGDTFTYSITVTSTSSVQTEEPRLPDLSGFDLLNSWVSSQSRSTFSGGKFEVEQSRLFNYMLTPQKTGELTIGSARVVVDGKAYQTEALKVQVNEGEAPVQPRAQTQGVPQSPFEELEEAFDQLLQRRFNPGFRSQPVNPNEAFFIQVEVDKTQAYAGEQVTANWYLYTRGQIRDIDTLKYPDLRGFWKEEIEMATRLNFEQEVVDGLAWNKALLVSYALFPISSGKAIVDEYKARCTVVTPSNFGLGRPYQFTKSSRPVDIEVKDLPVDGRPHDFSGAVGHFRLSAKVDQQEVSVNNPLTLKLRFEGQGNAKLIDLPPLDLPPSLELYDTRHEAQFYRDGTSYKEFELLLIPRDQGDILIPSVSFSYFNPDTSQYVSQSTDAITVKVLPGSDTPMLPSLSLAQVKSEVDDQIEVLPALILQWRPSSPQNGFLSPLLGWVFIYVAVLSLLIWRAIRQWGFGHKRKDLAKLVSIRLKSVRQLLDAGEWRQAGVQSTNIIYFVLGELSGLGGASMELEKMLAASPPSLRREVGDDLLQLMAKLEAISFAPEEMLGTFKDKKDLYSLIQKTEEILLRGIKVASEAEDILPAKGALT